LLSAGKIDEAEKQFEGLLKIYEEKSDYGSLARTYLSLGDISLARRQFSGAIAQYDKALATCKKDAQLLNQAGQAYMKKAALYFEWGKSKENQSEYEDALKKYDSSSGFYQRARDTFKRANNPVNINKAKDGSEEAQRRFNDIKEKLASQAGLQE
jgi:tetratricopeptide (TPR) repeat protein